MDCGKWREKNAIENCVFNCENYFCVQEFMQSEGIELNSSRGEASDPYMDSRRQPQHAYTTPSTYDKLRQFLELDRNVLRFYCVWDDRDSMFGEMRPYVSVAS